MRKSRRDLDMPSGKITRVKDFLPPPEELMAFEPTVKVTLRLSESSIKFFKHYAQKYHTKYQKVIRRLVDTYAKRFAMPKLPSAKLIKKIKQAEADIRARRIKTLDRIEKKLFTRQGTSA